MFKPVDKAVKEKQSKYDIVHDLAAQLIKDEPKEWQRNYFSSRVNVYYDMSEHLINHEIEEYYSSKFSNLAYLISFVMDTLYDLAHQAKDDGCSIYYNSGISGQGRPSPTELDVFAFALLSDECDTDNFTVSFTSQLATTKCIFATAEMLLRASGFEASWYTETEKIFNLTKEESALYRLGKEAALSEHSLDEVTQTLNQLVQSGAWKIAPAT
jgi:hypothetical protein